MRKLPSRKLLWTAIAGALLIPFNGFAIGLGDIEVNSALNQKLRANIELLSATPEDTENIIIKLASRKEFTRAGLDRPYTLNDLRFKSEVVDGNPIIKVTSSSPIREPYLNFLIEIDWPNGHLLREYTVLLDPPAFMSQMSSATSASPFQDESAGEGDDFRPETDDADNNISVTGSGFSSPRPQALGQAAAISAAKNTGSSAYVPAVVTKQQGTVNQPVGSYRIQSGDTAWSLADSMRPDNSISVEQMMVAMLRRNPESFINENINGLKRGYILRVPDYDQIASVNHNEARALVREQAALWRQFQQSVAGGQPVSAMPADGVVTASRAGTSTETDEDSARLEIVSAGKGASTAGSKDPGMMTAEELRAELALTRERVETERVEKEALQQRISSLENNVETMKGMLSIEDDQLSEIQSLNTTAGSTETELPSAQDSELAVPEDNASLTDVAAADEQTQQLADEMAAEEAEASSMDGEEEAIFVDETSETTDSMQAPVATDKAVPPTIVSPPAPADPLTQLLNDPMLLAAAGGGLLLIVALIGLIIRKRRKAAEEVEGTSVVTGAVDDLESIADDVAAETEQDLTGGFDSADDDMVSLPEEDEKTERFDSDSTMILNSPDDTVITEAGSTYIEEDEEPRDDVIAEADVYLAYGIYQQAEELLTQAITDNPDRDDYRVKLAETHYSAKNADAFMTVARDIRERTENDDSPVWKKVVVMGQDLLPNEALFQGSSLGDVDIESIAPKAPEMDFDLGAAESDASALDLSLDDGALELPEIDNATDDVIDEDATQILDVNELSAEVEEEVSEEPVDELEFDLSDTGAIEELVDSEDEFTLDIDASELDIEDDTETALDDEISIDVDDIDLDDIDTGLDEVKEEAEQANDEVKEEPEQAMAEEAETKAEEIVEEGSDIDIDFGLDETEVPDAEDIDIEDIAIDLSDETEALDDESVDLGFGEDELTEDELTEDEFTEPVQDIEEEIEDGFMELEAGSDSEETLISIDSDSDAGDEQEVDLDIEEEPSAEKVSTETDGFDDEDDFDLSSLDDVDEISTKLDLARAYLDMGDHEGTRSILEEVIAEGSDEQKQEAAELIATLD